MIWASVISLFVFALTAALHFGLLFKLDRSLSAIADRGLVTWTAAFCLIGALHVLEAGIYAAALSLGASSGLGAFDSAPSAIAGMDIFYFALVSYTSLGLGDIVPTGHLRLIAGIASLNGFLLISCSAAFLFRLVSRSASDREVVPETQIRQPRNRSGARHVAHQPKPNGE